MCLWRITLAIPNERFDESIERKAGAADNADGVEGSNHSLNLLGHPHDRWIDAGNLKEVSKLMSYPSCGGHDGEKRQDIDSIQHKPK